MLSGRLYECPSLGCKPVMEGWREKGGNGIECLKLRRNSNRQSKYWVKRDVAQTLKIRRRVKEDALRGIQRSNTQGPQGRGVTLGTVSKERRGDGKGRLLERMIEKYERAKEKEG